MALLMRFSKRTICQFALVNYNAEVTTWLKIACRDREHMRLVPTQRAPIGNVHFHMRKFPALPFLYKLVDMQQKKHLFVEFNLCMLPSAWVMIHALCLCQWENNLLICQRHSFTMATKPQLRRRTGDTEAKESAGSGSPLRSHSPPLSDGDRRVKKDASSARLRRTISTNRVQELERQEAVRKREAPDRP